MHKFLSFIHWNEFENIVCKTEYISLCPNLHYFTDLSDVIMTWEVQVSAAVPSPDRYSLIMIFQDFALEVESSCNYDYVRIEEPIGEWDCTPDHITVTS